MKEGIAEGACKSGDQDFLSGLLKVSVWILLKIGKEAMLFWGRREDYVCSQVVSNLSETDGSVGTDSGLLVVLGLCEVFEKVSVDVAV